MRADPNPSATPSGGANPAHLFAAALIDELASAGVRAVCICPGPRPPARAIAAPPPTPPPFGRLTHVAPRQPSPITLCTAMSAQKLLPSRIFEVSRYGESVPETSW